MSACNFEFLLQFVNNQLDPDKQTEVYDHLDRCDICRDAVYQISRDMDRLLFFYCAQFTKQSAFRSQTVIAGSGRAQMSANALARPVTRRTSKRTS
ncbi:MAG: hypothetical protein JXA73_01095 [Acidobacteria bacterium]|nr:hypothetical protein [Acidobacteriota bacterium]